MLLTRPHTLAHANKNTFSTREGFRPKGAKRSIIGVIVVIIILPPIHLSSSVLDPFDGKPSTKRGPPLNFGAKDFFVTTSPKAIMAE